MNSLAKLIRLLPTLLILLIACQPEEEQILENDPDLQEIENLISEAEERFFEPFARTAQDIAICGEPVEIPLMVYRNKQVGHVEIANTKDLLLVNYTTIPGFTLRKTMLLIMIEKEAKKNTRNRFYGKYRKYVYPVSHEPGTEGYHYEIPLSDLDLKTDKISIVAIAKIKEEKNKWKHRSLYAIARQSNLNSKGIFKCFLFDYTLQECIEETEPEPEPGSCEIQCNYGFGIPSVDVSKPFSFLDLGITDWPWGYAYEIKHEETIRLPVKMNDLEQAPVIGQVTIMIEGNYIYVYYHMNDGYPMSKTKLYLSPEQPASGVPCNYNYERDYTNPDGSWNPTIIDTYEFDNLDEIRDTNGKFWIITYVDFCE